MSSELVTIIMPVYNTKFEYLQVCIQSVCNQTYKDLEIIVIDDGSNLVNRKMYRELMQKDTRIHYYEEENRGASAARNYGIELAQGKYVTFIDSDDWIDETFVEKMLFGLKKNNVDIAFCNYYVQQVSRKIRGCYFSEDDEYIFENPELLQRLSINNMAVDGKCRKIASTWGKIYTRNIIDDIRFDSNLIFYEDTDFLCNVLKKLEKSSRKGAVFIPESLYYYRKHENSLTGDRGERYIYNMICSMDHFYENWRTEQALSRDLNEFMIECIFRCINVLYEVNDCKKAYRLLHYILNVPVCRKAIRGMRLRPFSINRMKKYALLKYRMIYVKLPIGNG